jgi:hypothetical protein
LADFGGWVAAAGTGVFLDVQGAVSASATQLVLRGEANGSSTVWDLLWRLPKEDVPFVMVDGALDR